MLMSRGGLHIQLEVLDERLKSLLEVFHRQFFMLTVLPHAVYSLGGDKDVADNLDDTIRSNTVLNVDSSKSIDLDFDQATVPCDIDGERFAFQKSREINVEDALGNTALVNGICSVIRI